MPGLKSGARPLQSQTKEYSPGQQLFREGEKGREMFIIKEGLVSIKKNIEGSEVELVSLGPGNVIGEMALLDKQPRSASGYAVEKTKVKVVNELVLNSVLEKIPRWLVGIIRIITSRLRDTNKQVNKCLLKDKELGVASMILLVSARKGKEINGTNAIEFNSCCNETMFTSRITIRDFLKMSEYLKKRGLIRELDSDKTKFILIPDPEALRLFVEFRKARRRGAEMEAENLEKSDIEILDLITYESQKSGKETREGTMLSSSAFFSSRDEKTVKAVESLQKRGLLDSFTSEEKEKFIVFDSKKLKRYKKIYNWLPRFKMKPGEK